MSGGTMPAALFNGGDLAPGVTHAEGGAWACKARWLSPLQVAWGGTVHGTYGTPEAGKCTAYAQQWPARGKLPYASGTYRTQEAGILQHYLRSN